MLEKYEVNKQVPSSIKTLLNKEGYVSRAFIGYDETLTVYIVLNSAKKSEIARFNNSLKIAVTEFDTLNYFLLKIKNNLDFEIPIISQNTTTDFDIKKLGNLCTFLLIDANQIKREFTLKGIRVLGLSSPVMEGVREGLDKSPKDINLLMRTNNEIMQNNTTLEMFKRANKRQDFKR